MAKAHPFQQKSLCTKMYHLSLCGNLKGSVQRMVFGELRFGHKAAPLGGPESLE